MNNETNLLTDKFAKQTFSGLIMMTAFTLFWTGVAFYGLNKSPLEWLLSLFLAACACFVYYAIYIKKIAHNLPVSTIAQDEHELKKREKRFMLICAGEGVGIFLAVNIVVNLHHPELQVPAIALVVGLHFFLLAKVFERTMDYYIGAWSTLVALLAITLTLNHTIGKMPMLVLTGGGLALATTFYGVNMVVKLNRLLANNKVK